MHISQCKNTQITTHQKMKNLSKITILFIIASVLLSCRVADTANHSNDGTYVGYAGFNLLAYVIKGNEVTIYINGMYNTEAIENTPEYIRLSSNGTVLEVTLNKDGIKTLSPTGLFGKFTEIKLINERTNLDHMVILNALSSGYKTL